MTIVIKKQSGAAYYKLHLITKQKEYENIFKQTEVSNLFYCIHSNLFYNKNIILITKHKNKMENLQFINQLGTSDFESSLLVQRAYRDFAYGEDIMEYGFNKNTGYVYIALENGVTIASCFGQEVDYITNDFETGEEYFFEEYNEALSSLK